MRHRPYAICPVCGDVVRVRQRGNLGLHPRAEPMSCAGSDTPARDTWQDVSLDHARRAILPEPVRCRDLVETLLRDGPATTRGLARASGYTTRRVRQVLVELRADGLVESVGYGLHRLASSEAA